MRKNHPLIRLKDYVIFTHALGLLSDQEKQEILNTIEQRTKKDLVGTDFFIPKKLT